MSFLDFSPKKRPSWLCYVEASPQKPLAAAMSEREPHKTGRFAPLMLRRSWSLADAQRAGPLDNS
jgi:hypothetical protein